jgi:tRNA(Ser,Leu) C12 N-acetylase TAN1
MPLVATVAEVLHRRRTDLADIRNAAIELIR